MNDNKENIQNTENKTKQFSKPAIVRLARTAGIKSMSDDCYDIIRELICSQITELVKTTLLINDEHQTKTIMPDDVYKALSLLGFNMAESSELSTHTCTKK